MPTKADVFFYSSIGVIGLYITKWIVSMNAFNKIMRTYYPEFAEKISAMVGKMMLTNFAFGVIAGLLIGLFVASKFKKGG